MQREITSASHSTEGCRVGLGSHSRLARATSQTQGASLDEPYSDDEKEEEEEEEEEEKEEYDFQDAQKEIVSLKVQIKLQKLYIHKLKEIGRAHV